MSFIFIPVCVLVLVSNLFYNDIIPPEEMLDAKISLSYRAVFTDNRVVVGDVYSSCKLAKEGYMIVTQ